MRKSGRINMSLPELSDGNITLRALSLEDANGAYPTWLNNPIVTQFNSHGSVKYTKEMAIDYIKSIQDSSTHHVFAIIFNQQHVGNISLQNINRNNHSAEFAILIGEPSIYGQGVGEKAGKLLLTYGFKTLKLHRIYCGTSEKNIGMQILAKKLNMEITDIVPNALKKNNQNYDVIQYERLNIVL